MPRQSRNCPESPRNCGVEFMDNHAGSLRRVIAWLIDGLLVIGILRMIYLRPNTFPGLIDARLLVVGGSLIVYEALLVYYLGSTIGKVIMGIRVADYATYGRPSLIQCFIRPWAKLFFGLAILNNVMISFAALLFSGVNFFRIVSNADHRGIHDKLTRTVALRTDRQALLKSIKA